MKRALLALGVATLIAGLAAPAAAAKPGRATLTGFASLPAATFVPDSEASGTALGTDPINGLTPPFAGQPVQGFSGIVARGRGVYDVLSDNGFGAKADSADFLLRVHQVKPDWRTGTVKVLGGFHLSDPAGHIAFPLTREDRLLTGADFDVESIVRAADGTYWIGDEFGPFLLHFSARGELLEAPIALPGVQAPENPYLNGEPNLGRSKGFEGMARSLDGKRLYPLLEGTVSGDRPGTLRMYEFDVRKRGYTGKRWLYPLDDPAHAIGDAVIVDRHRFLIIERDGAQGDAARTKKKTTTSRSPPAAPPASRTTTSSSPSGSRAPCTPPRARSADPLSPQGRLKLSGSNNDIRRNIPNAAVSTNRRRDRDARAF